MSTTNVTFKENTNREKIGNIDYGTFVTDVINGNGAIYIKVKKDRCGAGVTINHSKGKCVLLNIHYGTLREVNGDEYVHILQVDIQASYVRGFDIKEYLKTCE